MNDVGAPNRRIHDFGCTRGLPETGWATYWQNFNVKLPT
jgi:hypothetical protein